MHVYLVHATGTNRFKIGITARTIAHRMHELNGSQSAFPLELITYIRSPKYKDIERHLHEKYQQFRVHGEWFMFEPQQVQEVQSYMTTFDTPLNAFKPILKPKVKPQPLAIALPRLNLNWAFNLKLKRWIAPVLIGSGLLVAYHSYSTLPPVGDHAATTTATVKPKSLATPKLLHKSKRSTSKIKIAQ